MARFVSRDLSFVSLADAGFVGATENTQQCEGADGKTACTCCTNKTDRASFLAGDADLEALQEQLRTVCR